MDELDKRFDHAINCCKGFPMVQLTLSTYRAKEEMLLLEKYLKS